WPIPPDVSFYHCAEWSDIGESAAIEPLPYSASVAYELPLSANALFLISRSVGPGGPGMFSKGQVHYSQSEHVTGSVQVDITVHFGSKGDLNATKACLLTREKDEKGVGVFTKWEGIASRNEGETLRFELNVIFPQAYDHSPLVVNSLSTDLEPFSSQIFADMSNVYFKSLSLKSSLGNIYAEVSPALTTGNSTIKNIFGPIRLRVRSLLTESADIETSMGRIDGTFNASKTLNLTATFGSMIVDVNLATEPAKLEMHNNNGLIQGNINLESSKESGAAFDIIAYNSNMAIELDVLAAPLDSNITLSATTNLGAITIKLPTTYEGSFSAATSISSLAVDFNENAQDPAGKGRKRTMEYERIYKTVARGSIGWSEEGKTRGSVGARTSMAPVTLEF
ncbi:hypothetical protein B0H13DRAFT_2459744, partial [Mycena leptocephala]